MAKTLHGRNHDWALTGDIVLKKKKNGWIDLIRRGEKCNDCTRTRSQVIDINTGERVGSMTYGGDVLPLDDRLTTDSERLMWVATTSTDPAIRLQVGQHLG